MKTLKELKEKLTSVNNEPDKISKAEYIELGRNIKSVKSPRTGNQVTLGTFVSYTISYKTLHSWEHMSRIGLANLFMNIYNNFEFQYVEQPKTKSEYYVVETCYSWDRIVNKQEHVFKTYEGAKKFYDRKKKEFETGYETIKEVETRYFEDEEE